MKFEINRTELLKGLSIVEKALTSRESLNSSRGIKIKATEGKITFMAYKEELAVKYDLTSSFTVEEKGSVVLPGNHLINIIKKTNAETITFSSNNQTTLLKSKGSKVNLVEFDLDTYNETNFDSNSEAKIQVERKLLEMSYNQNKAAVATETTKPILTGINFSFESERVVISSTDAFRLAISTFNLGIAETDFTVNKNSLSDIIKILEIADVTKMELVNNGNQLFVESENLVIKSRLLEGIFPDIERFIPEDVLYSFVIEAQELKSTIEKVLLLSERSGANVVLQVIDNQIEITSQFRELGGIEERCDIDMLEGTPFKISFDPHFLLDAMHSINGKQLEMKFVDEISAFTIEQLGRNDNIQIISPLRMT